MREPAGNYLTVCVRVLSPERLINASLAQGIVFEEAERISARELRLRIALSHWPALRGVLRKLGGRFRVVSRQGPFFVLRRLRGRIWLFFSLILLAALLVGLSQRIWYIRIQSADVDADRLLSQLQAQGVRIGRKYDGQTLREIEDRMLIAYDDYTHIGLDQKGMVLRVWVFGATEKPFDAPAGACGDLVASCDAVIDQVHVYQGTAMVKPGDTVRAGQVLIAGVQLHGGQAERICALGDVTGRIWVSGYGESVMQREIFVPAGQETVRIRFQMPWDCDIIEDEQVYALEKQVHRTLPLLDGLFLNAVCRVDTHIRLERAPLLLGEQTAREEAITLAYEDALEKLPLGLAVRDTKTSSILQDGVAAARVSFEICLPIARAVYYTP